MCDPKLCHDAPDDGGRCEHCLLDRLDAAQASDADQLLRRAIDLRAALKLGVRVELNDIRADEFAAIRTLEDEQTRLERERLADPN